MNLRTFKVTLKKGEIVHSFLWQTDWGTDAMTACKPILDMAKSHAWDVEITPQYINTMEEIERKFLLSTMN